ncbi:MAG: bifunctional oligoribonuclease/PAP phosphatase NrnA [Elusimicrobia bacterium]|nr:bifunctional oligoribonuclease/PAP phosphatase NrnA [Elusimicrobiota bacterium]
MSKRKAVLNLEPPAALLKALKKGRSFAIVGHVKPDADTLGASLSMASLIRRLGSGRRIVLANANPVPPHLRFLSDSGKVIAPASREQLRGLDCAIYLECAHPDRAGGIAVASDFRLTINVDHHATGRGFADVNWVEPKASSNSEQVYLLFRKFKFTPTLKEAAWIYAGIVSDTGRFQYSLTSPLTHRAAAELLELGVPHTKIAERLFTIKSIEHLRLLSRSLESLTFHEGGRVAVQRLTRQDFLELDSQAGHTEDIVNYGLAPESVEVSLFFKEEPLRGPGVISVSLRSRGAIDVAAIAKEFGGGGHRNAAGCEIRNLDLPQAQAELLGRVSAVFGQRSFSN